MISPELLRRYPFFGALSEAQRREIAMLAMEETVVKGQTLLAECDPATYIYLLVDGGVDLYFIVKSESQPGLDKEFAVGEANPGELVGLSALIDPYQYTTTARASAAGRVVKIDALALRALCDRDIDLAYKLMHQVARQTLERLTAARVQLAAAWS